MLVQNILHFSSNECYFLSALSSTLQVINHPFPAHHFCFSLSSAIPEPAQLFGWQSTLV
jgi:hypothetical protein